MKSLKIQKLFLIFSIVFLSLSSAFSESTPKKHQWVLNETYTGSYPDSYKKLRYEIPVLMRQTMIDLSVRLGLNFDEGWNYPLTVQFIDGSPMGVENVLAYVQLGRNEDGFLQTLNLNVEAYAKGGFDYKKVFAHELVHAMLNDELGGEAAMKIPVWLHEGLAVYGADQGEKMVKTYVWEHSGFAEADLLHGLGGAHGALDYAQDYLAIKYIGVKRGPNYLHNFVQETIKKEGDYKAALSYTCYENWDQFQSNVKKFSEEEIHNVGPSEYGFDRKPY